MHTVFPLRLHTPLPRCLRIHAALVPQKLTTPGFHLPIAAAGACRQRRSMSKRAEHPADGDGDGQHPELKRPTTKRAKEIDEPDTPYDELVQVLDEQKEVDEVTGVAHWFRSKDLRIQDNVALHRASQLAGERGVPLLTFYVYCAPEFEWHGAGPARIDFIRRGLEAMQVELEGDGDDGGLRIPLTLVEAETRKDIVPAVLRHLEQNKISHLFANYEYEVDEVRRDHQVVGRVRGSTQVSLHHDQTIAEPGSMLGQGGKPQKVFTPYHKHWLGIVADDPSLLDTVPAPDANDEKNAATKSLFGSKLPVLDKEMQFESDEERKSIRKLWPAGHEAATKRLDDFLKSKIGDYAATRSDPSKDSTSRLSAYFATGMLSVREALGAVRAKNGDSANFGEGGAEAGVAAWVREICFRELYRQQLVVTPHVAMNLPQNLKFDYVRWEDDEEGWRRWCEGRTGEPFVDAGMRQLRAEAYMHNRLRMNVASYLRTNLLIDWRRGERHFARSLVDWDLANNTNGWEPSYTVFNPVSQAERNDPRGDYIRRWVPELRGVEGKAVFAPHARLSPDEFRKLAYPAPYVDWKETKQRAIERYKNDMAGVEP